MHGSSLIEAGGLSYKVLSQASGEEESVGPLRRRLSSAALCACTSFLTCVVRRLNVPSTVHEAMAGHKNLLKMSKRWPEDGREMASAACNFPEVVVGHKRRSFSTAISSQFTACVIIAVKID